MLLTNDIYRCPLSTSIQNEYNKLVTLVAQVSAIERQSNVLEGTGGMVRVSDLIAYQIGWGKLLMSWYEAGLEGKMPQMPGEGFVKWDYAGLAKHFYEKYHYDGCFKQDQEFYTLVKKIINITEHESETGNLDHQGVWNWCALSSGKLWPLSKWITVNTISPYKRASGLISKFIKQNKKFKN